MALTTRFLLRSLNDILGPIKCCSCFKFANPTLQNHSILQSISISMETVEFKVEMVGIHEKRLRKCLSKLKGVEKVEVESNSQKVTVTSYTTHRNKILKAMRRGGLKAEFWSSQNDLLNAYASATATYTNFRFSTSFSFF